MVGSGRWGRRSGRSCRWRRVRSTGPRCWREGRAVRRALGGPSAGAVEPAGDTADDEELDVVAVEEVDQRFDVERGFVVVNGLGQPSALTLGRLAARQPTPGPSRGCRSEMGGRVWWSPAASGVTMSRLLIDSALSARVCRRNARRCSRCRTHRRPGRIAHGTVPLRGLATRRAHTARQPPPTCKLGPSGPRS